MRILIGSAFFESELPSYREYSYAKELAALGHSVTLMCGDQSHIWSRSTLRLPSTQPMRFDAEFQKATGVRILRRHVIFRVSDFTLYIPSFRTIKEADVVHVIEFRQGVTLLIALCARVLGKPVVYDHEQRGDRRGRWYSKIDSVFRRLLILIGSFCVDCVRHTVLANRQHYRSCTFRTVEEIFAPLGVDPKRFYYDSKEREAVREELGILPGEKVAIMSGKLHGQKRVVDVVGACRRAGVHLVLVGTMSSEVSECMAHLEGGSEVVLLPQASSERLRALYNASDIGIFTTFTVSYWEAHATGLHLIVPASEFSQLVFAEDPHVTQFGQAEMFVVPDEQYRSTIDISEVVCNALLAYSPTERCSRVRFSAEDQCRHLSDLYRRLITRRNVTRAR